MTKHMKERPIIFSGDMVRAILDRRKAQTRRVIKPQPDFIRKSDVFGRWDVFGLTESEYGGALEEHTQRGTIACPYGVPGDGLWVRETWKHRGYGLPNDRNPARLKDWELNVRDWFYIHYKATNATQGVELPIRDCLAYTKKYVGGKWRPSIFMPRWASRITLEVTGVWAERLQEIDGLDAYSEGIALSPEDEELFYTCPNEWPTYEHIFLDPFKVLWDRLNAKRGYPFDSNCWVWVIEFQQNVPAETPMRTCRRGGKP